MTGIGPVGVCQPRVRDRGAADDAGRIRFTPAILPPYARRSRSLEVLIPILYLKGISTGDFEEALAALLGKDAPGLSASTIARLKEVWLDEHEHWNGIDDPTDAKSGTAESGSGSGAGPPDGATANVLDATDHVPDATVAAASCRAGGRGAAAKGRVAGL